jgi:hypothetical protein
MTEHPVVRVATAFIPLALSPALAAAINAGILSFGGGDKDIVLIIPWVLWSLAYAVVALVCWRRRVGLPSSLLWAAIWATGLTLAVALVFAPHFLGVSAKR